MIALASIVDPADTMPVEMSGGQFVAQAPVQSDVVLVSGSKRYRARPAASVKYLPEPPLRVIRLTPEVLDPELGEELGGAVEAGGGEVPPPAPALVVVFVLEPHAVMARAVRAARAAIPAPRGERVDRFGAAASARHAAVV